MRARRIPTALCAASALAACSGTADQPVEAPEEERPPPEAESEAPQEEPAGLAAPNQPPGFEIPAWTRVGVGQEISFGLEVVDEESDQIEVDLVEKPDSARFDPTTLTVSWRPTRKDLPVGHFKVMVIERQLDDGGARIFEHRFSIDVTRRRQPAPTAQPLGPVVETLLTIHDEERLARLNRQWPLDRMLAHGAENARGWMPEEKREEIGEPDRDELYRSFLKGFAEANKNPIVDPDAEEFDEEGFGDPRDWKIIAVRPRLDKRWQELRIVYQAAAHADTYAMFKWGPVHGRPSEEARLFNNRTFSRMVLEAFFTEGGELDPELFRNKRRHGRAVADFVESVLTFESSEHPWAGAHFHGLPCEARLGGGSARGPDGGYASGDAWAWNVMKAKPKDGAMRYVNVPIKGFATDVAPSEDGSSWAMKCAPRFDPDHPDYDPHLGGLCRDSGHVDLPATGDGYRDAEGAGEDAEVVSSKMDAANMFLEHKREHMVEQVPLRDPRRDLFEEKGMTCSQCHVRKFGVRDMYDETAYDPSAGAPTRWNKKQATTYFVIVPTERWQPYAIDFQQKQECKARDAFETYLDQETSLGCPLKVE